jgi:ADP-ribosylarginine hydrolase
MSNNKNMFKNIKPKKSVLSIDRIYSILKLAAIGDTIGFIWETNYDQWEKPKPKNNEEQWINTHSGLSNNIVFEFISLGSIRKFNCVNKIVSDDTILHLAVADALTSKYKNNDELVKNIANSMVNYYNNDKKKNDRLYGNRTIKGLKRIKDNYKKSRKYELSINAVGSGCAMRTMCIGMIFFGKKNRDKLIEISIESSRCTHNNPIGYLGGLVSALFTAYAIEGIDKYKWVFNLLELLNSNNFNKILKKLIYKFHPSDEKELNKHMEFKNIFIEYWQNYKEWRFSNNEFINIGKMRHLILPWQRVKEYWERFAYDKTRFFPGSTGIDSVIIAYDCLLDADDNFDKIIFYAVLNSGDSDTIGTIACAWYAAIYNFGNATLSLADGLEKDDQIFELTNKISKIYT